MAASPTQVAESGQTLGQMADALPPVYMLKTKVAADDLPAGDGLAEALKQLGPGEIDSRDGLKWVGQDGWVHVRPSNTEPVVRIIAEAKDEAAAAELIAKVKSAV